MKHFGVYAVLSVMLVVLFGGFTFPEKTFAQETSTGSVQGDLDKGVALFTTQINYLQNSNLADRRGAPTVEALVKVTKYSQSIFVDLYNAEIKAGTKPEEAFRLGLVGSSNALRAPYFLTNAKYGDESLSLTSDEKKLLDPNADNLLLGDYSAKRILDSFINVLGVAQPGVFKESTPGGSNATITNAQKQAGAVIKQEAKVGCSNLVTDFLNCMSEGATWFVKTILLQLVGFAMWASANLLNYAMYHGVFQFKNFAPDSIYQIWLVIRQIISLFVFFAGLFIGFMAIIGKSEEFKKYIAFLVVFGLFVNFSYPIVRVFVDISNVVSLQIYQTTLGPGVLSDGSAGSAGDLFMKKMGLQDLVVKATAANPGGTVKFQDTIASLPGALAAVGFVGYAAYIFFMAAFLLIARTALLVCIIIASPILLVDTVVPALGEKAQWLRGMFISQLFVAPVFTIMLALTLKFLDVFNTTSGNVLNEAAAADGVAVFFNLVMMIVMLHIMLKVTKAVAGGVGETVTKWAGKAGGLGVGATAGLAFAGAGFAGRQGFGRIGEQLGKQGGVIGDLGRKMSGAKYDLRNLSTVQSLAQTAGISGMGKGVDKSRKDAEDARNAENAKIAGSLDGEEERNQFLRRKFGAGSKELRNFAKEDDEMLKQYVNADEDKRKEMMSDPNNQRFYRRFGQIQGGDTSGISDKVKTALDAKLAKDKAAEIRNRDRVANFLTADQATRESMLANAMSSNDKKLLEQLDIMRDLSTRPAGTLDQQTDLLAKLNDADLVQKILANDMARASSMKVQEAETLAKETVQKTQVAAAQAQVQAAQDTKSALDAMVQSNNDLAAHIKSMASA